MSESESYAKAEFFRKPNFPNVSECCGLNTRHDTYSFDTSTNFALTNMPPVNPRKWAYDYQRYSMLTVLPLRSIYPRQIRRRPFLIHFEKFFVHDEECYDENMS